MKKLFTIGLMLLTGFVYGQDYKSFDTQTKTKTTGLLIWNSNKGEFDFHTNNDMQSFIVNWMFVLNTSKGIGTVTSNNLTYDIAEITPSTTSEGVPMLILKAFILPAKNEVIMVLTTTQNGEVFVAIYDYKIRKSYYFN